VPIDRAATLRNAEKLLRQGKLEAAIADYVRVVEDQPSDWNTANTLGDLYSRAGQIDRAVEQFTRIADSLNVEGFVSKAVALYKKVLKLQPDNEHALLQAGEIAAGQGLLADARSYLTSLADRRHARGDSRGAARIRVRLGTIDPSDYERRIAAAAARVELGEVAEALQDLKQISAELCEKDRRPEALEALRQAVLLNAADEDVRTQLISGYVDLEDFAHAREYATTVEELKGVADALDLRGRHDEALETLRDALWVAPDDADLKAHFARALFARGDVAGAADYLTADMSGDDPHMILMAVEAQLRSGRLDEGGAAARRYLDIDPEGQEQLALLSCAIAEQSADAGFRALDVAVEAAAARSDWTWAAAALQEFVRRVPNYIPVLIRFVEVCVDGSLDELMSNAQATLADAYLAAGSAGEASAIAEDLVVREPGNPANVERLRRALELMNEPDPDAVIAECLSAHSLLAGEGDFRAVEARKSSQPPAPPAPLHAPPPAERRTPSSEPHAVHAAPRTAPRGIAAPRPGSSPAILPHPRPSGSDHQFDLSSNAVDIESILGEFEGRSTAHATSESVEVDLSIVLDDFKRQAPIKAQDLDGVFENLRDEASRRSAIQVAEAEYTRGLALRQAGDIDGCIQALRSAGRAPTLRFASASLAGRLLKERGSIAESIEWFEQAAQAPAPTPAEYHDLLYELADALERLGESTRALAICMELQAEAGPYRDVAARVDRLSKVQARE